MGILLRNCDRTGRANLRTGPAACADDLYTFANTVFLGVGLAVGFSVAFGFAVGLGAGVAVGVGFGNSISLFA